MQKLYLALSGPCTWKTAIKLFKQDFFLFFGITGETEHPDDLSGPSPQWCLDTTSSISCNHVSAEILLWWGTVWIYSGSHITYYLIPKWSLFFPRDPEASKTPIHIFQAHRDLAVPAACWKKPRARSGGRLWEGRRQGAERAPGLQPPAPRAQPPRGTDTRTASHLPTRRLLSQPKLSHIFSLGKEKIAYLRDI